MKRLKKRADFLKLAKGAAVRMPGFILQYLEGAAAHYEVDKAYVGFTITKRQGNAVLRNRIRRRLREAVRLANASHAIAPGKYALIGRKESLTISFSALRDSLVKAFVKAENDAIAKRTKN
jgi:ribonuclease P protein component